MGLYSSDSLEILLPTQNRASVLARALEFYEKESLDYKIHLIDSSHKNVKAEIRQTIKSNDLDIDFHDYTFGVSLSDKLLQTLGDIKAEFVLLVADDDFILPSAISRCIAFLDSNPDYTAASGRSYSFELDEVEVYGPVKSFKAYPQLESVANIPVKRFRHHMRNWTTSAYSVQRTSNLKRIMGGYNKLFSDIRMMEIYWYATNVIVGKVAKLDMPYMFRQTDLAKEWHADSYLDWTETVCFVEEKKLLINELAKELANNSSKPYSYYWKVCEKAVDGWLKVRRPFCFRNVFDYSIGYYWRKLNEKTVRNTVVRSDLEAVERIRLAVRGPCIET